MHQMVCQRSWDSVPFAAGTAKKEQRFNNETKLLPEFATPRRIFCLGWYSHSCHPGYVPSIDARHCPAPEELERLGSDTDMQGGIHTRRACGAFSQSMVDKYYTRYSLELCSIEYGVRTTVRPASSELPYRGRREMPPRGIGAYIHNGLVPL